MQNINLLAELAQAQTELEQAALIDEVHAILKSEFVSESKISTRLNESQRESYTDQSWMSLLDKEKIFSTACIEKICVRYRLRFLNSALFKGQIPVEAVRKVKRIEGDLGVNFSGFHILAPSERFNLKDSTKDPILMAELPNGQYYFIFQWGDDMKWYQYLLKYPFRHIGALAVCSAVIGTVVAFLVPSQFEAIKAEFFYRFFMFSMTTCLVMTLTIITAIMHSKDFSENVWNSKFIK